MIEVVNPVTGEVQELTVPQSLDDANEQLAVLRHGLSTLSRELTAKRRELCGLAVEYTAREAALIVSSQLGEASQRRAEAVGELFTGGGSLGARKFAAEMEVRILLERSHNIRSAMNTLQTTSANMRAEANLRGDAGWPR